MEAPPQSKLPVLYLRHFFFPLVKSFLLLVILISIPGHPGSLPVSCGSGFLGSTPCPPPPCDTPDLWCRQGKDWGLLQPLWLAVPSSQQELHVVLPKQPFTIF